MKRLFLFFLAAGLLATDFSADAQQSRPKRTRTRARRVVRTAPSGDSTYTFATRNNRGVMGKSMSTNTEGVLGEDTIRVTEKGAVINRNYNTGVPLPPNSGGTAVR